ncbi:MAG TPA: NAD-dependent epimerase/dehydratase family protein [Gemmatimonadales bacterium]|jgi:nucleoside-diphosphate-sugar epimerase|nr:NAD-dependent epimerase/dehydratase family protein [Gemmatimonadales bacterium]
MTRVLVTGAAGFIGSHLVEALLAQGDEVLGVDNFDPFYSRDMKERNLAEARKAAGFSFMEQDVLNVPAIRKRLTPDTVVVHLAAKAGVRPSLADPVGYASANVTGTATMLEAARQAGVSRIVFGSSSSVYGDSTPVPFREDAVAVMPVSPYAATKRAAELFLSSVAPIYRFRAASLRFFTVYGPRQRPDLAIHAFTRKITEGQALTLFGDGTQARDYTYSSDIIAGVLAAIRWTETAPIGVETFNLGGNRAIPTEDMVAEIARALGIQPRIEWAPMQPGDVQRTAADLTKSKAVLGYTPKTPFAEGIRCFVHWFREAYGRAD